MKIKKIYSTCSNFLDGRSVFSLKWVKLINNSWKNDKKSSGAGKNLLFLIDSKNYKKK